MRVLWLSFCGLALLSLYGLLRFSFNLVFVYLFLLSAAAGLWSWLASGRERSREAGAEED